MDAENRELLPARPRHPLLFQSAGLQTKIDILAGPSQTRVDVYCFKGNCEMSDGHFFQQNREFASTWSPSLFLLSLGNAKRNERAETNSDFSSDGSFFCPLLN
ncbi:hypothetical protein VIGAN_07116000 [Vigna angularis var. angularis]|uniref:Uncharacterized protein n=1 Tax=Vigna angularis var. angularis TaxID=157739 RepID=A0A0S3SI20_PHAAN|nr:hypothetical protein VIGAN_07116000 [Vigna angularis var. angularis]